GELLVTSSYDSTVRLWDVATGKERWVLEGHAGRVRSAGFGPRGRLVASGGYDKSVRLWDVASGKEHRVLTGHTGAVLSVSFSPDGRQLATGGYDNTVRLWDLASEEERRPVRHGHQDAVLGVAFSPDGKLVASGGYDHGLRLWDVATGHQEHVLTGHLLPINGVSFSADGKLLASASADNTVRLWDVASPGAQRGVLVGHEASVLGVDFSPDGTLLASASSDDSVRLWSVASGKQLRQLEGHGAAVNAVSFSPQGDWLASASWDHDVRIWNVASGATAQVLSGHTDAVNGVSFGPRGARLASASTDKTLRIWNRASGAEELKLEHGARLYWPVFHPDGKRAGASSSDGTARLWNLATRAPLDLRGHSAEVNSLDLTVDGKLAVTASDDGTVRLWDAATGKPIWRAPLLLSPRALDEKNGSPQLLSHQGWIALSDEVPNGTPVTRGAAQWSRAVEQRALFAVQAPTGSLLCVQTYEDGLEIWDLAADRRLAAHQVVGLEQILAVPNGCVTRGGASAAADNSVVLHHRSGASRALAVEGQPSALGTGSGEILVAAGTQVFAFQHDGQPSGRWRVGTGVTAVTRGKAPDGERSVLVVGYRDGNIELFPADSGKPKPDYFFEQVPSSPVLRILAGPMDTLLVGFANGMVGIWSQDNGSRLEHARIHGQVTHLLLEGHELYVATDLGQHLVWDLDVFNADHCELLRHIWRRVPVVWEAGRPVKQAPPSNLPCRPDP
ncbi:MAG: hypothetical protein JRI68_33085, partial [Deltaproteobacteria bacterium]|nr:hypothetical protein [Deltaproteobacteria bacterium]